MREIMLIVIVFIDYGYDEKVPSGDFQVVSSLHEAVDKIIQGGE